MSGSINTLIFLRLLMAAVAVGVVYGCGAEVTQQNDRTMTSSRASGDNTKNDGKGAADAGSGEGVDDTDGDGKGDGVKGSGDGTDGDESEGDVDGSDGSDEARIFFDATVKPMMEVNCVSCHADPRLTVAVRAPLSIYSYASMRAMLATGQGPQSNGFYDKVRNISAHTGGDRCSSNPTASPCLEIMDWWRAEFGDGAGGGGVDAPRGKITDVTTLGEVHGYAYDPTDTTMAVTVNLYGDGPKGSGTLIASVVANQAGSDGDTPGNHAFIYQLPAAWRDGQSHGLHVYIGDSDEPMATTPRAYTAYSFSTAGRNFYNANVRTALNSCTGCHTITYEQQFYSLIAPSPALGGTATNNQLINKPAQVNGVRHGGGMRCNGINASPCNVIQQWWAIEFGG